jgi:peptide/nickel transport system permease protein
VATAVSIIEAAIAIKCIEVMVLKGYVKYYGGKIIWYLVTFIFAILLNFILPRLMPGNPVANLVANATTGITDASAVQQIQKEYTEKFGLDKSYPEQFLIYVGNLMKGDLGVSFSKYPRQVSDIIGSAAGWTLCLQLPSILVGWFLGNLLGALAAYIRKGFDKVLMPLFMFCSNVPAFGMAYFLLWIFAIKNKVFPVSGGYGFDMIPNMSWEFVSSVLYHYWLPFFSIILITIGGQAIGMRSMSIYELNADYVKYSRFLGIKDSKIVRYVFRNAMLPQITGLALSLGTMIGGNLVAEVVFSYPGLGSVMLSAITGRDYPLLSGCTLIITMMVLIANLVLELLYAVIDPRIKATQIENG